MLLLCMLAFLAGITGCSKESKDAKKASPAHPLVAEKETSPETQTRAERPDVPVGTLRGVVSLKKGEALPDLQGRPLFGYISAGKKPSSWPASCTALSKEDFQPLHASAQRGLEGC
ncbi:MAG: hypothetical protein IPJ88_07985 [Myxococcales bacterium]|nr:MAG: hypothetical protein IPJ88_07985 [Myxococcales bacterium]